MRSDSVFVVINPSAGRGRGGRRIAHFRGLLRAHVPHARLATTTRAGEEAALTDAALADGHRTVVAVGGDGTWSQVADRIVASGRRDVALALLPAGTGNDFGKTFGITFDRAEAIVRAIAAGPRRRIDVGRVGSRHFLNVVGFGFDIAVIDDAADFPVLKGDLLYRFCALRQLFRFPGVPLAVHAGDRTLADAEHLMLIVANAEFFGGSFHIAPEADLADGELDVVCIRNAGPLGRAALFRKVAAGTHGTDERVDILRGSDFRISFPGPLRYEIDGDVHTADGTSVAVASVPGALELVIPEGDA